MISFIERNKMLFSIGFLLLCLIKPTYAILEINDFNGDGGDLGWTLNNITIPAPAEQTAEGTVNAGEINSATGQYSDGVPADNDEADWDNTYNNQYLSLYVWGNGNSSETLTIKIIEEDYNRTDPSLAAVEQTWSATVEFPVAGGLNWTGWKYFMFKLPDGTTVNDFTPSGANADDPANWNPAWTAEVPGVPPVYRPELRGVKRIEFETNANIYIDQVAISNVSTKNGWVREIFPSNDNNANSIDITLSRLPPTISAVFGPSTDLTDSSNKIVVVDSSTPTINLCSSNGDDDGIGGWLVTPSSGSYVAGNIYTVFIHPVKDVGGSKEPGRCEVITFTTATPSSTIENKYKRSLTN